MNELSIQMPGVHARTHPTPLKTESHPIQAPMEAVVAYLFDANKDSLSRNEGYPCEYYPDRLGWVRLLDLDDATEPGQGSGRVLRLDAILVTSDDGRTTGEYWEAGACLKLGKAIELTLIPAKAQQTTIAVRCYQLEAWPHVEKLLDGMPEGWATAAAQQTKAEEASKKRTRWAIPDYQESLPKAYWQFHHRNARRPSSSDLAAIFAVDEKTIDRYIAKIRRGRCTWPPPPPNEA